MNKIFLSVITLVLLSSCSGESAYRFRELDGNTRTFKKSEYTCYYEKQKENTFYVECFSKNGENMVFFFADKVMDEGGDK